MANFIKRGPAKLTSNHKGNGGLDYYATKKYTCPECDNYYVRYEGDICENCSKDNSLATASGETFNSGV